MSDLPDTSPTAIPGAEIPAIAIGGALRRVARNSAVYVVADVIAKGGAYALIPLLTRGLTPSGFGTYTLVVSMIPVLTILSSLGMSGAVTRMWFELDAQERKRFQAAAWLSTQSVAAAIAIAFTLIARPLFGAIFSGVDTSVFVFGVWTSFFLASATVPLAVLRAEEKPKRFAVLSAAQFLGPAAGVVVGLVVGDGVQDALWGHTIGASVVLLASLAYLKPIVAGPPAWSAMRPALALALPIVPHLAAHWALNVADRVAIQRTFGAAAGTAAVALYAVGYQIAQGVSLVATAVNNAIVPSFYRAAGREDRTTLSHGWTLLLYGIGVVAVCVSLYAEELVALLAKDSYRGSAQFVPWVALGYWFLAAYYFPVNALFYAKRVRVIPLATISAAGLNYGLNVWLLPQQGLIAAARNTAISYGVLLLLVTIAAQRAYRIDYALRRAALLGVSGAACVWVGTVLPDGFMGTVAKIPVAIIFVVAGFIIVRRDVAGITNAGGKITADHSAKRVVLAAATATQARTMTACDEALRAAGMDPDYVSLDPILGKSASLGFSEAGVVWRDAPALRGTAGIVLNGRGAAANICGDASAIVLGNDFSAMERLLIEHARISGAASILVQDGVIALQGNAVGGGARSGSLIVRVMKRALSSAGFPFDARAYGMGGCDAVCVYGPSTANALAARGVDPETIVITGQPRYDAMPRTAAAQGTGTGAAQGTGSGSGATQGTGSRAAGEVRTGAGIVLVTTQPFSRYGLATADDETTTFAAMIDAALMRGAGREVVVKLHPDTDAASSAALQKRFSGRVRFQQQGRIEDLYAEADLLITLSSTTALEAMIFFVPVVVVDVPGFPTTLPYVESGAVVAATTLVALPGAVDEALASASERAAATREFLAKHLAPLDGHAAQRVAAAAAAAAARRMAIS